MMEAMFEEMKENGIPGKKCRVKQRTRSKRKRKGFIGIPSYEKVNTDVSNDENNDCVNNIVQNVNDNNTVDSPPRTPVADSPPPPNKKKLYRHRKSSQ